MKRGSLALAGLAVLLLTTANAHADHRRRGRYLRSATCLAKYGRIKCGFACTAGYGRIACAKTPMGVCSRGNGRATCWDPPARRRRLRRAQWILQRRAGRARCVGNYGRIKCGYSCIAKYGRIKCARTPLGVCTAAYGRIKCWDPPWARAPRMRRRYRQPRCVSAYGRSKCGYSCVAQYGRIKCAKTPMGVCKASYGRIACWDPK